MYYYLRGRVSLVTDEMAVIDVGGIGFEISIINPHDFIVGEEMLVYTQHIVKDDDELLVGFRTKEEKNLFNKLITVKGIGPKTAISALHNVSVDEFLTWVETDNIKALKKLPSIGAKAAGQIILDLKGSLRSSTLTNIAMNQNNLSLSLNQNQEDAKKVLLSLGFKKGDIDSYLLKIPETLSASEIVSEVLKKAGK